MTNKINIKNLECFGFHGVFEEEKSLGQKFIVSVELSVDFSKAVESDQCEDTVDYGKISQFIISEVKKTKFNLIEALADYLAKQILIQYSLAFEKIEQSEWIRQVKMSNLIETKPYGYEKQGNFINGVIGFQTLMYPKQLLSFLQSIETELKRVREIHWGPRTIDLDILFFGQLVSEEQELILPHPEICKRDFVLKPLCELNPYWIHPVEQKRICCIYEELVSGDSYEKTILSN